MLLWIWIAVALIVLSGLSTAIASAAHGQGWLDKGLGGKKVVVILHIIAAPLVAPIFWIVFRRHKQADAELDLFGDSVGNYDAVRRAYYIWPLGNIMAHLMRYCMEKPWKFLGPTPTRMQQELCHAAVGLFLGVLTLPLALYLNSILF